MAAEPGCLPLLFPDILVSQQSENSPSDFIALYQQVLEYFRRQEEEVGKVEQEEVEKVEQKPWFSLLTLAYYFCSI